MEPRFKAGDAVEVQVGGRLGAWREARIERPAPYRGREGYYILWNLPVDAPMWESRGGWQQGAFVRAAVPAMTWKRPNPCECVSAFCMCGKAAH